jgi:hypothetical protein
MLQNRKLTEDLGHRWYDWTQVKKNRSNSKLAQTRDVTSQRGYTRIEISVPFLTNSDVLSGLVNSFIDMIPSHIIYSTPHSSMWNAFWDNMKHTLIVCDEEYQDEEMKRDKKKGLAIVVYGYNKLTKDLSGFIVIDWQKRMLPILERYTLAAHLPIDLITVSPISRHITNYKFRSIELELSGAIYVKSMLKNQKDLTCMSEHHGQFIKHTPKVSQDDMDRFGFVDHHNCHLYIPHQQIAETSRRWATIDLVGDFIPKTCDFKHTSSELKSALSLDKKNFSSPTTIIVDNFKTLPIVKLGKLLPGFYDIHGIIVHESTNEYPKFIFNISGVLYQVYGTQTLLDAAKLAFDNLHTYISKTIDPICRLELHYHSIATSKTKTSFVTFNL